MTDLTSIYSPNSTAKPGENTAALFSQLPPPVKTELDIKALRLGVAELDKQCAFPYPKGICSNDFKARDIEKIPAHIYQYDAIKQNKDTATIVVIHGGGFCCELVDVHKSLLANIIARVPCHGVLPQYALAPEAKAPQAIDEITTILKALLTEPEKYGVTNNLVLIGYSAGGNLAWNAILNLLHSTSKKLIDSISRLILMSPWTDVSLKTTESGLYLKQQAMDKMCQTWTLEQMRDWYLPKGATGQEPAFSPIYRSSDEMIGMPPTTIIAGEIDRLLHDAIMATHVLHKAEIPVELVVLEGQSHNHSAHNALRDGVFTPDIIANIIQRKPVTDMKGTDCLGIKHYDLKI
ncbi:MAG: alpha/beta fold hydrolase [Pseudomonadota bacterium]